MKASYIRGIVQAVSMVLFGMVIMARVYCEQLGITSGSMFVGWDTVAFTLGGVGALNILVLFDPSFRD